MIRKLRTVLSLGIILTAANLGVQVQKYKPTDTIYVGVLDDAREEHANFEPGISQQRIVRPLFEKNAKGWSEVNASSLPNHITWTAAFDGKNLGRVKTQASPTASRRFRGF